MYADNPTVSAVGKSLRTPIDQLNPYNLYDNNCTLLYTSKTNAKLMTI